MTDKHEERHLTDITFRSKMDKATELAHRITTHEHIKNPVYNPLWLAGYREAQSNIAAAIRARGR